MWWRESQYDSRKCSKLLTDFGVLVLFFWGLCVCPLNFQRGRDYLKLKRVFALKTVCSTTQGPAVMPGPIQLWKLSLLLLASLLPLAPRCDFRWLLANGSSQKLRMGLTSSPLLSLNSLPWLSTTGKLKAGLSSSSSPPLPLAPSCAGAVLSVGAS